MKVFSRLKITAEEEKLLKADDYEVYKNENGWWNVRPKTKGVPYIHSYQAFKDALKAHNFLNSEIYKYNTKNIMNIRKALISKLHKLFKAAGMQKCKDMSSSIKGYRPITEHGYRIYTYPGDRTSFYIGFTADSIEKEYKPKVLKILDKEGIKYNAGSSDIWIDMQKQ